MIPWLICAGILCAPPELARADDARAGEVARLVGQLDARRLTERDLAEQALAAMGPEILPLLPPVDERTPAEVGRRLSRLRQQLLRAQAVSAAQAARVKLQGDNLSLAAVLADIARQTGNPIRDHRAAFGQRTDDRRVRARFDNAPFWQALDELLDQADLTLYGFAGERGLFVVNRPPGDAPRAERASYSGIFRFEPVRFEAQRDLRNQEQGSLHFFMDVSWEPRLQPFAIVLSRSEISAVGSNGGPIAPALGQGQSETLVREGFSTTQLEIPFTLPPRGIDAIRLLKGKLLALVPGPLADFHFRNLRRGGPNSSPKSVEQRNGNTVVTVGELRANGDRWEVPLRLRIEAPTAALESHRGWILENEAYFEDAQGRRIAPGGFEQTLHSPEEIGVQYLFDLPDGPENLTLVYRTPLVILELSLAFEFHDLRLP